LAKGLLLHAGWASVGDLLVRREAGGRKKERERVGVGRKEGGREEV
jgi:hypothetical protein